MPVSIVKGILWVGIAIGVAMLIAAAAPVLDRDASRGLLLGGCVLLGLAIVWYRHFIPREVVSLQEQLLTLKQQFIGTGEPVVVKAWSGFPLIVLSVLLVAFYVHQALTSPSTGSIVMLAGTVLTTVVIVGVVVPRVGRSALTIRPDGIDVPVYGFLSWDEIESIGLQRFHYRGAVTYSIDLYVPQLRQRECEINPFLRVMGRILRPRSSADFIIVHLIAPSLPAALAYALCHELWHERTGKTNSWTASQFAWQQKE